MREIFSMSLRWGARGGVDVSTHRGVVGGDINQDLRGAPATHVSVAVPHTANQVGLSPGGKNKEHTQWPLSTLSPLFIITDAAFYNLIHSSRLRMKAI